jgi:O-antigen/teichoic acid export membrane protein
MQRLLGDPGIGDPLAATKALPCENDDPTNCPGPAQCDEEANVSGSFANDESRAGSALLWKVVQMGGSKVLYVIGTLVLGRILTPDDFGLVAIAMVAFFTAIVATDMGMQPALVQLRDRRSEHYHLAWSVGLLRGAVVTGLLFLSAPWLADVFAEPRAVPLLQLIAFKPLIDAFASPHLADLIREFKFKELAAIEILAVAVELPVAVMLAPAWGGKAIIIGRLIGGATRVLLSYGMAPYRPKLRLKTAAARELIAFGRWMLAIGITGVAVEFALKVLVSRRLGVAELGVLFLAGRLASAPTQFAGAAIASAAFPLYARLRDDGARLGAAFGAHLIGAMLLLLPVTALVIGLAQPLQDHVLGAAWAGTAPMIALLALAYSLRVVFDALVPLMQGMGRTRQLFLLELLGFGVLLSSAVALIGPLRLTGVAVAWALSGAVTSIAAAIWARKRLERTRRSIAQAAVAVLLVSVATGAVAHLSATGLGGISGVVVGCVAGIAVWFLLAAASERWLRTEFRLAAATFFPRIAPTMSRSPSPMSTRS